RMRSWIQKVTGAAVIVAAAGMVAAAGSGARAAEKGKTVRLFNGKNFDGLYTFIPGDGKNNDPQGVFTIEDGGIIHVRSYKFGYVSTEKEYENYKLLLEFKWGEKKFPPRENAKRDAGILYHCVGPDKVWMKSLEFQIQE